MQQQYVAELHVVKELCFGSEDMVQQSNSSSLKEQTGSIQQLEALLVQTTLGFWQENGQQRAVSVGYIKEDFSCGRRSAQQHTRRKTRAASPRGHAVSQIGAIVFFPSYPKSELFSLRDFTQIRGKQGCSGQMCKSTKPNSWWLLKHT